jgi:hypothetical protein
MKPVIRFILFAVVVGLLVGIFFYLRRPWGNNWRSLTVMQWLRNPQDHPDWAIHAGARCQGAPFIFPTDGLIGYLWDDSFQVGHRHQAIDIFGGAGPGKVPVVAAYDGYLTRLPDWKSSVIVRIPDDPLKSGRQIWVYYTHMADANGQSYISSEFPVGITEAFIRAGTHLGYQGDYSGDPANPVGVHLHFSIVMDNGSGKFLNELQIGNTLNPSLYFGLNLNGRTNEREIPQCR